MKNEWTDGMEYMRLAADVAKFLIEQHGIDRASQITNFMTAFFESGDPEAIIKCVPHIRMKRLTNADWKNHG